MNRSGFLLDVSVFAVLQRHDDVLLIRRAGTGWMDGFLSLPAGRHDGAEPLDVAAARELREETTVDVSPEALRLVHTLHCFSGARNSEWLGLFFATRDWSGTPTVAEPQKHDLVSWAPQGALPQNVIPYVRQGILMGLSGVPFSTFGWE